MNNNKAGRRNLRWNQIYSLRTQMLFTLVVVVIITAVAAWFPESLLIRNEFEQQTWARVEQGRRTARTLYNGWQSEVTHAALLTAQLPTLKNLLTSGSSADLAAYLQTVETSLELDLVLACNMEGEVAAQIGELTMPDLCSLPDSVGFYIPPQSDSPSAWLLAAQPVLVEGTLAGQIVAGIRLDDTFATQMRGETELQHTLFVDGIPVATSFTAGLPARLEAETSRRQLNDDGTEQVAFITNDGRSFYAARLPLDNPRIVDEVALSSNEIAATQRSLIQTSVISILAAIFIGSLIGILISRRITNPLLHLDKTAARIKDGDLDTAISVQSQVKEIKRMADTLEQARIELRHSLSTLQQEKAWIDHLLQAIVEGIMILDEDGRITFFSDGATRITGWTEEEIINNHCDDYFTVSEGDMPFSQAIPQSNRRRTIWVNLSQGRAAALSLTRAQLLPPEAESAQVAVVFRDVTEEEALQRLHRNFLTNITHEFRTPLTALAASVELLLDQTESLSQSELQQMLNWLHLGILGLQTLVDNLLETASLEAGRFKISPHPTELGEIIAEATRLVEPLLQKYQQQLVIEMPMRTMPLVYADARRMVQVMVNLLSNANKYGPADSEIAITTQLMNGKVKIGVADRGPGIPTGYETDLFHRFLHVDVANDNKRFGIGLGLWVVKAIVEEHGGQVGVDSRPDGGSIFWFTLPLVEDQ